MYITLPEKLQATLSAVLIVGALCSGAAHAEPVDPQPQERGLEIAVEADKRDAGFGDSRNSMEMVLRNRHGEETERRMRSKTLEQENDGDKTLIVFDNPRDVKGTAFLSFTHKSGPDDQWLYLPALKRVKRISSSNKSGPFMGSEFAFEDLSSQEVEKYTYKYLRDEVWEERDHFVIERVPVDPKSGYSRQEVWLDKDHYRVWKIDFYDRKGDLLKTLSASDYKQFLDEYWRARQFAMVNHQTGKSTDLYFNDWQFDNGFSDQDFNKNSLRRAR
ncbi:outer membrane lipoprotein-sorting protein [Marinimicrobium sp. C2-29]|uniref:outer membrane lipoprotein-sorting protein n=1 Tax=Marinimicrobium sp. C2-29 TaxID=3139825 RepID=UPI00313A22BA